MLFWDYWKVHRLDNVELVPGKPKWVPEGTYYDPHRKGGGTGRGGSSPDITKDKTETVEYETPFEKKPGGVFHLEPFPIHFFYFPLQIFRQSCWQKHKTMQKIIESLFLTQESFKISNSIWNLQNILENWVFPYQPIIKIYPKKLFDKII